MKTELVRRYFQAEDLVSLLENPNEIVDIAEMILEFNGQRQIQGLKILTANEMLSRLLIPSAQSKARNNYQKLKNEIRLLLCSLYR